MTAERCSNCGREPENGVTTHWIGCPVPGLAARKPQAERENTRESECIKDGCTNPRAVSKGPRPTKYCDEHKTGSKR